MGLSDAFGKFIMPDIGAPGRKTDSSIFRDSEVGKRFYTNQMNLSPPEAIYENGPILPYYIIGNEGFPLENFIMCPFPRRANLSFRQKVFSYRLCRPRREVECSFGMLVQRFRIFRQSIIANVDTAKLIVKTAVCLHNFILERHRTIITDKNKDGFRKDSRIENYFESNEQINNHPLQFQSITIRKQLAEYFMRQGPVPWQYQKVRNGDY